MSEDGRYPIPARTHRVTDTIQRSRFVTTLAHAPDPAAAHALVAAVRDEFPDATHHCWAFVAGPPGSTARIGMSDDGEPHGTAGRPMLTALLHGGVGEIAAVCTRYFGGVKLGTGGLSRAYGGGVKRALASLPTEERVERVAVLLTVAYPDVDTVQRLVDAHEVVLEDEEYGARARYRCAVAAADLERFTAAVADATRGEAVVERL